MIRNTQTGSNNHEDIKNASEPAKYFLRYNSHKLARLGQDP